MFDCFLVDLITLSDLHTANILNKQSSNLGVGRGANTGYEMLHMVWALVNAVMYLRVS